jgi:C1A family cysteine protease
MKKTLILSCAIVLLYSACKKSSDDTPVTPVTPVTPDEFQFGWLATDNPSGIPSSVGNIGVGSGTVPSSYDLTQYLPPIGNQGQYGTCVGWSTGYYAKSATEAIALNRSATDLASAANQISAKDLFIAIPDSKKGAADCNGTNFTDALDILQTRGAATLQVVPYSGLNDCSVANLQASWTADAAGHKIKYYRKINADANTVKEQVSNKLPVVFGAKVYDNFQTWNTNDVYSSLSGNFSGNHAITIVGYDDAKGPNGAFKVVNSWGNAWGAAGFIWVDYNFMFAQFAMGDNFYIMANDDGNVNPTPPPNTTGVDVAPWAFSDYSSNFPNERKIALNLYNIGNQSLPASADWAVYYIYYNAYDANDYGIMFYDQFNTSVSPGSYDCPTTDNCVFNFDLPAGANFANLIFGIPSVERTYYVPDITGYYYLMLYADPADVLSEQNEQNNVFYTTSQYPAYFQNGYAGKNGTANVNTTDLNFRNDMTPNSQVLRKNKYNSAVSTVAPNAYTPEEILFFMKKQKQTGKLSQKLAEFKNVQKSNTNPYRK